MKLKNVALDKAGRDTVVTRLMEKYTIPGVSMAVLSGGEPAALHTWGVADRDTGAAVTTDTVFEAASLTKTLFACLALRQLDRGIISLDQPMAPQIPELRLSQDPRYQRVTPRHALAHATGFPNWAAKPFDMTFDPGTSFGYSGEGYYLLQRMMEIPLGKQLPQLFEEHFFLPWGMKSSAAVWSPALDMSRGFDVKGEMYPARSGVDTGGNAPEPNAAWSLYTTPGDYAKYLINLFRNQGGLTREAWLEMITPQNRVNDDISWSLGWGMVNEDPDLLWHWGDNTGYESIAVFDWKTGDGMVIFTGSDNGNRFCLEVCDALCEGGYYGKIMDFIATAE